MKTLKITLFALLFSTSTTFLIANNSEKISHMTRDVIIAPSKNGAARIRDKHLLLPHQTHSASLQQPLQVLV